MSLASLNIFGVSPEIFNWVMLPALIFCARIVDVSIGTLRIILLSRGNRCWAPVLGFFEITVWLVAIGSIMKNLSNPICYLAYGGGYATGTWIGILLENKLSLGTVMIRIITRKDATELARFLRTADYAITTIDAEGAQGPVKVIFTVVKRQEVDNIVNIIKLYNPQAFYSIEDVRFVTDQVRPVAPKGFRRLLRGLVGK